MKAVALFAFAVSSAAAAAAFDGDGGVVPRRIVAVYDGNVERAPRVTRIHRYAELPLNYLGFQMEYLDLSRGALPDELDADVAALIVWFDEPPPETIRFPEWAAAVRRAGPDPDGLKIIAFGNPGLLPIRRAPQSCSDGRRPEASRRCAPIIGRSSECVMLGRFPYILARSLRKRRSSAL